MQKFIAHLWKCDLRLTADKSPNASVLQIFLKFNYTLTWARKDTLKRGETESCRPEVETSPAPCADLLFQTFLQLDTILFDESTMVPNVIMTETTSGCLLDSPSHRPLSCCSTLNLNISLPRVRQFNDLQMDSALLSRWWQCVLLT